MGYQKKPPDEHNRVSSQEQRHPTWEFWRSAWVFSMPFVSLHSLETNLFCYLACIHKIAPWHVIQVTNRLFVDTSAELMHLTHFLFHMSCASTSRFFLDFTTHTYELCQLCTLNYSCFILLRDLILFFLMQWLPQLGQPMVLQAH